VSVERLDQLEAEIRRVRSFITEDERPDVGPIPGDVVPEGALVAPQRLPADPDVIVPPVETRDDAAPEAPRAGGTT